MKTKIYLIIFLLALNCFVFGQDETSPKIIELGKINQFATVLPMPTYLMGNVKGAKGSEVGVDVKIHLQTGEVVEANAIYGHPFFKKHCENFAMKAKFRPILQEFSTIYAKGILAYKVDEFDGKVIENKKAQPILSFAKSGIINALAIDLQKPIYPQKAKEFCAKGKVEVEVLIDEKGDVIGARAISGDEFLHDSAVEAVRKTKFRLHDHFQVKTKGIIIYNFDSLAPKCVDAGIANKRALKIPKTQIANLNHLKHFRITKEEIVEVQIIVDFEGNVKNARAISGHPILRNACVISAKNTKFSSVNDVPRNILVNAKLVYKFKPNGTIEF